MQEPLSALQLSPLPTLLAVVHHFQQLVYYTVQSQYLG